MSNPRETTRALRHLLASGMHHRAERMLLPMRQAERGALLAQLTPHEIRVVMDMLFANQRAASTLLDLKPELLTRVLAALENERIARIMSELDGDELLDLYVDLGKERRDAVRPLLPAAQLAIIENARKYPPDSAGRAMSTNFIALREDASAQQVIELLRARSADDESIQYLYVVDGAERLRGVVPIRRLLSSNADAPCSTLMIQNPVSVTAQMDQEEVAQQVARYNLLAMPVVDENAKLLGVITVDDVIEVIHEEATRDIYNLAGMTDADRIGTPARDAIRKRLPWMMLNLAAVFVTAWVIGLFESTLEQVVALTFFMPVVAGMGGGGGIQSLTVITRAIALGEIEFSSGLRVVGREVFVATTIGVIAGLASGVLAWAWRGNPWFGAALSVTMLATIAVAGLLGAVVPLLLKAAGFDPAVGSGVFVTTLTDVFSFSFFLTVGKLLTEHLV